MSHAPPRVVLDTVIFLQALISGRGTAAGCLERLKTGRFILLLSHATLAEMREVPLRPELTSRYPQLTPERVDAFFKDIESIAVTIAVPPSTFHLPRDHKDEPFVDLAIAGDAQYIVTWNEKHLTYLMKQDTPEGRDFCHRFPNLKIVSPPVFLAALDALAKAP